MHRYTTLVQYYTKSFLNIAGVTLNMCEALGLNEGQNIRVGYTLIDNGLLRLLLTTMEVPMTLPYLKFNLKSFDFISKLNAYDSSHLLNIFVHGRSSVCIVRLFTNFQILPKIFVVRATTFAAYLCVQANPYNLFPMSNLFPRLEFCQYSRSGLPHHNVSTPIVINA